MVVLKDRLANCICLVLSKKPHIMKAYMICIYLLFSIELCLAQDGTILEKGNKIFVENKSKNENAVKTTEELITRLNEWAYWPVVAKEEDAAIKMSVEISASKGITLTSWGGTSYILVAKLINKKGAVLWESNAYKSSPNGTNGFNSGRAVVKKLMRDLKKKFDE